MKAKVLLIVVMMSVSAVLFAQPKDRENQRPFRGDRTEMRRGHDGPAQGLNLTNEQKEAFKQSMLAMQKQLQPLRNQLGEAEAHQRTLTTAEKPDLKDIDKNIEKIGGLKIEMAKIRTKNHLEMRARLTEEQRLKFDNAKGKMMRDGVGQGMRNGKSERMK